MSGSWYGRPRSAATVATAAGPAAYLVRSARAVTTATTAATATNQTRDASTMPVVPTAWSHAQTKGTARNAPVACRFISSPRAESPRERRRASATTWPSSSALAPSVSRHASTSARTMVPATTNTRPGRRGAPTASSSVWVRVDTGP